MTARKRVGVLISGRGSNLNALIEAAKAPDYPAEIVLVISNQPGVGGLVYAAQGGIDMDIIDHRKFSSREDFDAAMQASLEEANVEILCNAGFMRLLTEGFVERWRDRHLNIHPSLLPAFKGLKTHEQVLAAGVRVTGCTVHIVRHEMDSGPILAQAAVPVLPDDSAETLAARVLEAEHRLYPLALKLFASGAARIEGDKVTLPDTAKSEGVLYSPALGS